MRNRFKGLTLLAGLLLQAAALTAQSPLSGRYTINANEATAGTNYQTFNEVVTALTINGIAGPVVLAVVKGSGPYHEQVIIPAIAGASASNTITFDGNGEKLYAEASSSTQRAVVKLDGADYITLYQLDIEAREGDEEYGYGVHLINDADYNTIRKCTIRGVFNEVSSNNGCGITFSGNHNRATSNAAANCDFNRIDSNVITGGYHGIAVTSLDDAFIYGNSITNNVIKDFAAMGIYTSASHNAIIAGNDISRPTATTSDEDFVGGIWLAPGCTGIKVTGNRIHHLFVVQTWSPPSCWGITIRASHGTADSLNVYSNNLLYAFGGESEQFGIQLSPTGSDATYSKIYHNTVLLDDAAVTAAARTYCMHVAAPDLTGVEIKNNIFSIQRTTSQVGFGLYISSNEPLPALACDYNDILVDNTTGFMKTAYVAGVQYRTLANWQAAYGKDAHSLAIDPLFTDKATGNYLPAATAMDNKGTAAGVLRDIVAARRNTSNPDIGAYEFGCEATTVVVEPDSVAVCAGEKAVFTVKNPQSGFTYEWYTASETTTPAGTGTQFTTGAITAGAPYVYYSEAVTATGCGSGVRTPVKAAGLQKLSAAPVVVTGAVTAESVVFTWQAVPGTKEYLVSRNYRDFVTPSTGKLGLSHTVNGLNAGDTLSLVVKATADLACQATLSDSAFARTLSYRFFVPNMFTPNGDGQNDQLFVYGRTIQAMRMMIFNQWGQKVFETTDQQRGWDGIFNGKPATIGVYAYVITVSFGGGNTQTGKGSISLIR